MMALPFPGGSATGLSATDACAGPLSMMEANATQRVMFRNGPLERAGITLRRIGPLGTPPGGPLVLAIYTLHCALQKPMNICICKPQIYRGLLEAAPRRLGVDLKADVEISDVVIERKSLR